MNTPCCFTFSVELTRNEVPQSLGHSTKSKSAGGRQLSTSLGFIRLHRKTYSTKSKPEFINPPVYSTKSMALDSSTFSALLKRCFRFHRKQFVVGVASFDSVEYAEPNEVEYGQDGIIRRFRLRRNKAGHRLWLSTKSNTHKVESILRQKGKIRQPILLKSSFYVISLSTFTFCISGFIFSSRDFCSSNFCFCEWFRIAKFKKICLFRGKSLDFSCVSCWNFKLLCCIIVRLGLDPSTKSNTRLTISSWNSLTAILL